MAKIEKKKYILQAFNEHWYNKSKQPTQQHQNFAKTLKINCGGCGGSISDLNSANWSGYSGLSASIRIFVKFWNSGLDQYDIIFGKVCLNKKA